MKELAERQVELMAKHAMREAQRLQREEAEVMII
jgi:hypothetical protein